MTPGPRRIGLWSHWRGDRVRLQSQSHVESHVSPQARPSGREGAPGGTARAALRCALESRSRDEAEEDRGAPVSGGASAAGDPRGGRGDPPGARPGRSGQPVHRVSRSRPGLGPPL